MRVVKQFSAAKVGNASSLNPFGAVWEGFFPARSLASAGFDCLLEGTGESDDKDLDMLTESQCDLKLHLFMSQLLPTSPVIWDFQTIAGPAQLEQPPSFGMHVGFPSLEEASRYRGFS